MYHPSAYNPHNEALNRFCLAFNEAAAQTGGIITMQPSASENFREDGAIVYQPTGEKILYDFEKRNTYYDGYGSFRFPTFGQFERKIQKPEIALSIQCSKNEDGFIIAWHADYLKEKIVYLSSKTATGSENNGKRFTKDFIEIRYAEMPKFYQILLKAFTSKRFDATSFEG